jgi:hypothetical protein
MPAITVRSVTHSSSSRVEYKLPVAVRLLSEDWRLIIEGSNSKRDVSEMQYYTDGRTTCVDWPATPPSLRSALFTLTPGMTSCGSLAGHWRTTSPSLGQSGSLWLRDHSQTSAVAAKAPRHAAALLKGPLASTAGQRHHPHCAQPYVHCPRG